MKKLIVFDKDDTITLPKQPMDRQMAELFSKLLQKYKVAIITWWDFKIIYQQIIEILPDKSCFENLYLLPTVWTSMWVFENNKWVEKYSEKLTKQEAKFITSVLEKALTDLDLYPEKVWGDIIENRWSQITYSWLWQKAPLEEKKNFDPDKKIRQKIVDYIKNDLKNYSIWIAGSTSIDITKKWFDKAYGVKKLMNYLNLTKDEILFIWDAIFPWGNDYPVKQLWIECIKVNSLDETRKIIQNLIAW